MRKSGKAVSKRMVFCLVIGMMAIWFMACGSNKQTDEKGKEDIQTVEAEEAPDTVEETGEALVENPEETLAEEEDKKQEEETDNNTDNNVQMDTDKALELYSAVLAKVDRDDMYVKHYKFIYLNDDDIPEMTLSEGYGEHDRVQVYAIINGEAKQLYYKDEYGKIDSFGGQGAIDYTEKNGMIEDGYYSGNKYECTVLQWDGVSEELSAAIKRAIVSPIGGTREYQISGKSVGAYQYYEFVNSCMAGDEFTVNYDNSFDVDEMSYSDACKRAENDRVENYVNRIAKAIGGLVNKENIQYAVHDFDGDGYREMFAVYDEKMWFANKDKCQRIKNEPGYENAYISAPGKIVSGDTALAYAYTDKVVTDLMTDVWVVIDGEPVFCDISDLGCIEPTVNQYMAGDFTLTTSAYDMMYSVSDGFMLGHTWKPYFYNYGAGKYKMYESHNITYDSIKSLCGFDLIKKIKEAGNSIMDVCELDNEIIVVNYSHEENGDTYYNYILWDERGGINGKGSYYGCDVSDGDKWQEYAGEGTYQWR